MEKVITIPKRLTENGELVVIPRREYERLLGRQKIAAEDVLRWTKEAKSLKKAGRLSKLNSLGGFRK